MNPAGEQNTMKEEIKTVRNYPTHHQIATHLTNYALSELVRYVIEDTGCGIEQAMEKVYNSPLMDILQDEEGELYVQSPAYLYELMIEHTAEEIEGL
jgi:hypothetical protein